MSMYSTLLYSVCYMALALFLRRLQERVRTGQASSEEYFELGAVMLRKKFYSLANKYLLQAIAKWEGDEQELAQVRGALMM